MMKVRYARIASNVTIPKLWRSISIYALIFIIACIAILLLSLTGLAFWAKAQAECGLI